MDKRPIGIFDSGVGGLSVAIEIAKLLPNEELVYLADSLNCPYGPKTQDEIIELSIKNTEFLISKGCKLIVVACNTATAAAIDTLRLKFKLPFVGMEPAIKPAAKNTNTGKIGILATEGTFNGRLFKETSEKYAKDIDKLIQVGEGLVELVETNTYNTQPAKMLLKKYIQPMVDQHVDQIVLGCTHYPFFKSMIKSMIPDNIKVVDPAPAIANRVKSLLEELSLLNHQDNHSNSFYSTGTIDTLKLLINALQLNYCKVVQVTLDTN